jgi:hypothetical protein
VPLSYDVLGIFHALSTSDGLIRTKSLVSQEHQWFLKCIHYAKINVCGERWSIGLGSVLFYFVFHED